MINKVILVGRLGKDPDVRHLENGVVVASFPMATDEVYRDKNGEKVKKTDWHNITVWRKQAEIAEQYLKQGSLIYVEGKLKTRSYDDKDGNKRYITEVVADTFTMLGGRRDNSDNENDSGETESNMSKSGSSGNFSVEEEPSDDLPF